MLQIRRENTRTHKLGAMDEKTERRPVRLWPILLVILLTTGVSGWFWLARDPEKREQMVRRMIELGTVARDITASLQGAAASLRNRVAGIPPRPGETMSETQTLPGAPPRLGVSGSVRTPEEVEKALAEQIAPIEGGASERGRLSDTSSIPPDAGRRDDAVVRVAFIDDLARWLVEGYTPAKRAGRAGAVDVNLQAANLRYGLGMKGLAWIGQDIAAGRTAALEHFFTPSMLDAIYKMYIDRFMDTLTQVASEPRPDGITLTPEQQREMYRLYSRRFRGMSGALQGVAALPDFPEQMEKMKAASQEVVNARARYSDLVLTQAAVRAGGDNARIGEAQEQVQAASHAYRQAVREREQIRATLAGGIRKNQAARLLDDDTLLYVASWVERRVTGAPDKMDAVLQGATLFLELARRFEAAEGAAAPASFPAGLHLPSTGSSSAADAELWPGGITGIEPLQEEAGP